MDGLDPFITLECLEFCWYIDPDAWVDTMAEFDPFWDADA